MTGGWLLTASVVMIGAAAAVYFERLPFTFRSRSQFLAKPMLSAAQRDVFTQLVAALPGQHVFPGVALASFIAPRKVSAGRAIRARLERIGRSVADVVICDAAWRPVAVVAFATKRRLGRRRQSEHDGMLKDLGIDVHVIDPSVQLEVQALIGKLRGTGDA
ncbi:DUF2726 domain-containing protein [Burkholderia cepacia]|uniref:DUF2726 domain-containing protein n=1 Tax=Burkholderia cepacia TaxID=292 RepID=UPI002AB6C238|nr:DUF2726 domain-containing protein [Burkholderia cepacia]